MSSKKQKPFSKNILYIESIETVCEKIIDKLRNDVSHKLYRRGAIVGISGGIDSSVVLALSAKAFGPNKVLGIMLPEKDSSADSEILARKLANKYDVMTLVENITLALDGFGCYQRRDEAIAKVINDFDPSIDKTKIEIKPNINENIPAFFFRL